MPDGGGPAVMIGDSITDLHTARAAGAPCILLSYGYTPVPAASLGADMVLDDFAAVAGGAEPPVLLTVTASVSGCHKSVSGLIASRQDGKSNRKLPFAMA